MFEIYDNVYFIDADRKVNKGAIEDIVEAGYVVSFITADGEARLTKRQVFKSFDEAFAVLLGSKPIANSILQRFVTEWNVGIAETGKLTATTLCEQLQIGAHMTLLDEDINPSVEIYVVLKHGRKYLITVPTAMVNCSDILDDHEQIQYLGTAEFFEPTPKDALKAPKKAKKG